MINLEDFKKSLGKQVNFLSDDDILELRKNQDQMADIFFEMWLSEIKDKKTNV